MADFSITGERLAEVQLNFINARVDVIDALSRLSFHDPRVYIKIGFLLEKAEAALEEIDAEMLTKLLNILHNNSNLFKDPNDFIRLYAQYLSYSVATVSQARLRELTAETINLYKNLCHKLDECWIQDETLTFAATVLLRSVSEQVALGETRDGVIMMKSFDWLASKYPLLANYTTAQIYQRMGENEIAIHFYKGMIEVLDRGTPESSPEPKDGIELKIISLEIQQLQASKDQGGATKLQESKILDKLIAICQSNSPSAIEPAKSILYLDAQLLLAQLFLVDGKKDLVSKVLTKNPELFLPDYHGTNAARALESEVSQNT